MISYDYICVYSCEISIKRWTRILKLMLREQKLDPNWGSAWVLMDQTFIGFHHEWLMGKSRAYPCFNHQL